MSCATINLYADEETWDEVVKRVVDCQDAYYNAVIEHRLLEKKMRKIDMVFVCAVLISLVALIAFFRTSVIANVAYFSVLLTCIVEQFLTSFRVKKSTAVVDDLNQKLMDAYTASFMQAKKLVETVTQIQDVLLGSGKSVN